MKGIFSCIDVLSHQERTIERLKEQRDRDEREKQEEIDNYKKDLKDLKEKVSLLQGDLSEKEVKITEMELFGLLSQCIVCWFLHITYKKVFDRRFFLIFYSKLFEKNLGIFKEALQSHSRLDHLYPKSYLFQCVMSWFLTR